MKHSSKHDHLIEDILTRLDRGEDVRALLAEHPTVAKEVEAIEMLQRRFEELHNTLPLPQKDGLMRALAQAGVASVSSNRSLRSPFFTIFGVGGPMVVVALLMLVFLVDSTLPGTPSVATRESGENTMLPPSVDTMMMSMKGAALAPVEPGTVAAIVTNADQSFSSEYEVAAESDQDFDFVVADTMELTNFISSYDEAKL